MVRRAGFTLVELMVAVAIVGLIAAFGYPYYLDSVTHVRRSDAQSALVSSATLIQRCYSENGAYNHATCRALFPRPSAAAMYQITLTPTASTYQLTATPLADGPQHNDRHCTTLTLDHLGTQAATGETPSACW